MVVSDLGKGHRSVNEMVRLVHGWLFVFVFGVASSVCAGTADSHTIDSLEKRSDTNGTIDRITVYGARRSLTTPSVQEAQEQADETPGGTTVRSADHFQEGPARSLCDLLKNTPGVYLESDGTEISRVSIRGSGIQADDGPIGIQFLLDGIPMNDAEGEADIDDYDLRAIRYAEIYKGANSLDNGAYNLGGAINFVSPTGYDADRLRFHVDGGDFGEAAADISAGGVKGPIDWYASVAGRRGDGYRIHSAQKGGNFFGDLGWKLTPGLENRFYLNVVSLGRELSGGLSHDEANTAPTQADPDSAISQNFGTSETMARIADRLTFTKGDDRIGFGVYWQLRNEEERSFYGAESFDGIYDFTDDNFGASGKVEAKCMILQFPCKVTGGLGMTYESEDGENYVNAGGVKGVQTGSGLRTAVNTPLYGSVRIDLLKNLAVMIGCQVTYAMRRFEDRTGASDDDSGDAPVHTVNLFGANPRIGLLFGMGKDAQAFVNFNHSWQPPSFDQMVEIDTSAGGGYDFSALLPQQAWTAEAGVRSERGVVEWNLSVYRSWVSDELLEMNDVHGSDIGTVNVAHTVHQGIEAGLKVEILNSLFIHALEASLANRLTLNQSYTFNDFSFDNDPVYGRNRIAGVPVHLYEAELRFESPEGFYAGPQVQCNITRYPADQANTQFVDPYATIGISAGYHAKKGASIYCEVRNMFDNHYAGGVTPIPDARAVDGPARIFQPGEGRSFFGGVGWSW
jgi:iron complex outermembrane receptor protein